MRTGNFKIEPMRIRTGLLGTARVQVLMVEVDEPIDQNNRARFWREATDNDRMVYEHQQKELRCLKELAEDRVERLKDRLDNIADLAIRA